MIDINFFVVQKGHPIPNKGHNTLYLNVDRWDDYTFKTQFHLSIIDSNGNHENIGNVKIGFKGQKEASSTQSYLGENFKTLPDDFFSVRQDLDYYNKIFALPSDLREALLRGLKDIVFDSSLINNFHNEKVFSNSLLRSVSLSVIKGQFSRILQGLPPLTNFEFKFVRPNSERMSAIELNFLVLVESKPSTNIHAIIGRNGVGKTTILNGMIQAITSKGSSDAKFFDEESWDSAPIATDYFSSLVSVSFSAFDPFEPPKEQPDPSLGTCYFYIGLKKQDDQLKTVHDIHQDFLQALISCLSQGSKRDRWLKAIDTLESDENFAGMDLKSLADPSKHSVASNAQKKIKRMSSGHAIVLLIITRLVATVEEKTLVLIDEPESHLHPPLLSAFIRALAELLHDRNGVSIIATHSPVVLQEVPKSSVWKINRNGLITAPYRPAIETFGENVGVLTREVFGLEVVKSGFHDLLVKSVESGKPYQSIINEYNDQLGLEARALLKALVMNRDRGAN